MWTVQKAMRYVEQHEWKKCEDESVGVVVSQACLNLPTDGPRVAR